jgi:hypothetical protein
MPPHPLQAALDRANTALYTCVDLLDVAAMRNPRKGRPDGRQPSLYRATVASCVGTLEEATEALTCEALRSQGVNSGMTLIERAVSKVMQTPSPDKIRDLMTGFLGYNPIPDWKVSLRTAKASFTPPKKPITVNGSAVMQLWTFYGQERTWSGTGAATVMNRFVRIRHAFAHQDSSIRLLDANEVRLVRNVLSRAKASNQSDETFVEQLNAVCAVQVLNPTGATQDPIYDWKLHDTHALNVFLCTLGVISSMADGLAGFLEQNVGVKRATYDPLQLRVQEGAWVELAGASLAVSPCGVDWILEPYTPLARPRATRP